MRNLYSTLTFGGLNEQWLIRTARYLAFVGAAGAVVAIANALPGIDFPGEMDATIIALAGPVLAGLDRWFRAQAS